MASKNAKKRKLNENEQDSENKQERLREIKKYAEDVNLQIEEGCYGERDLLEDCKDEFVVQKRSGGFSN